MDNQRLKRYFDEVREQLHVAMHYDNRIEYIQGEIIISAHGHRYKVLNHLNYKDMTRDCTLIESMVLERCVIEDAWMERVWVPDEERMKCKIWWKGQTYRGLSKLGSASAAMQAYNKWLKSRARYG